MSLELAVALLSLLAVSVSTGLWFAWKSSSIIRTRGKHGRPTTTS